MSEHVNEPIPVKKPNSEAEPPRRSAIRQFLDYAFLGTP